MPQGSSQSLEPARGREIAVVKIGGSILINAGAYRRAAIFVRSMLRAMKSTLAGRSARRDRFAGALGPENSSRT